MTRARSRRSEPLGEAGRSAQHPARSALAQALLTEYAEALDDLETPAEHAQAVRYLAVQYGLTPAVVAGFLKAWREDQGLLCAWQRPRPLEAS